MIEYEDDSENSFTYARADELFAVKDANTFMTELFADATDGAEGAQLANQVSERDYDEDLLPAGFTITEVESEGGNEGGGEYVSRVYEIAYAGTQKVYVKSTGSYYSYNGTDWHDEFRFVQPREVLVTQYFNF